jgi:hypothetical protein
VVVEHLGERPAPQAGPAPVVPPPPPAPGSLYLNSTPWGQFSIDGTPMGNTPGVGISISPGHHLIVVSRDGYVPAQLSIDVAPGAVVRLTAITLRELTP